MPMTLRPLWCTPAVANGYSAPCVYAHVRVLQLSEVNLILGPYLNGNSFLHDVNLSPDNQTRAPYS